MCSRAFINVAAPKTLAVPGAGAVHLLGYDPVAMEAEVLLLTEWFYPAAAGQADCFGTARDEFVAAWRKALALLRDGVARRRLCATITPRILMWLDDRKGVARAGLAGFSGRACGLAGL